MIKKGAIIVAISCCLVSTAFAAIDDDYDSYSAYANQTNQCPVYDPYEGVNRKIFTFNSALDYFTLKPIAKTYNHLTNEYIRERVGSVISNIGTPYSFINYSMQGNGEAALKSLWRFLINSTLGIGGLFDVASKFGIMAESRNFSSTLAHYGVGPGPYLILPIYGSMNARELLDYLVLSEALDPVRWQFTDTIKWTFIGVKMVHDRAEIMPFTDYISQNSTDPYVAIRDALHQRKESMVTYKPGFKCP